MLKVIKRDCTEVDFDKGKIVNAILMAMKNGSGIVKEKIAEDIVMSLSNTADSIMEISISSIGLVGLDE